MDSSPALPSEKQRHKPHRLLGIGIVSLGLLLLAASGGYFLYSVLARDNLDALIYTPFEGSGSGDAEALNEPPFLLLLQDTAPVSSDSTTPTAFPDPARQRLFPGESISFRYWAYPWAAQPVAPTDDLLAKDFGRVDPDAIGAIGSLPQVTRVSISAIDIDAAVNELAIINLGDSRAYETPKNVVGHIPESANPGEVGNVWLFGHLESPFLGEGSVFRNLPKIPGLLRKGERVYIVLETSSGEYLYEAVETDVLYKDDLALYPADQPTLTLVTCVPRLVYDHRLLVTANLVGFKASGS